MRRRPPDPTRRRRPMCPPSSRRDATTNVRTALRALSPCCPFILFQISKLQHLVSPQNTTLTRPSIFIDIVPFHILNMNILVTELSTNKQHILLRLASFYSVRRDCIFIDIVPFHILQLLLSYGHWLICRRFLWLAVASVFAGDFSGIPAHPLANTDRYTNSHVSSSSYPPANTDSYTKSAFLLHCHVTKVV